MRVWLVHCNCESSVQYISQAPLGIVVKNIVGRSSALSLVYVSMTIDYHSNSHLL